MTIEQLIDKAVTLHASDIHITADSEVFFRICGLLVAQGVIIHSDELKQYIQTNNLSRDWVSIVYHPKCRIRAAYSSTHAGDTLALRLIASTFETLDELNLPKDLSKCSNFRQGLTLIAGATGSGKTTTATAILNEIVNSRHIHLITLENPIERIFSTECSKVSQQEFGTDFSSFSKAAEMAMHQDPDVIYFGELADYDTIQHALTLAETGHYVIGTIHTRGAIEAVNRIVDIFESGRQSFVKAQLLSVLRCVCWQALIPIAGGRIPLVELMYMTPTIEIAINQGKPIDAIRYSLTTQPACVSRINSAISLISRGVRKDDVAEYLTESEIKTLDLRGIK